jgi:threonine dehydrogenase-like Zn-dependent dehydrogenase
MRAALMYRAGDVRIENVPDARLIEPADAIITITAACICGSEATMEIKRSGSRPSAKVTVAARQMRAPRRQAAR